VSCYAGNSGNVSKPTGDGETSVRTFGGADRRRNAVTAESRDLGLPCWGSADREGGGLLARMPPGRVLRRMTKRSPLVQRTRINSKSHTSATFLTGTATRGDGVPEISFGPGTPKTRLGNYLQDFSASPPLAVHSGPLALKGRRNWLRHLRSICTRGDSTRDPVVTATMRDLPNFKAFLGWRANSAAGSPRPHQARGAQPPVRHQHPVVSAGPGLGQKGLGNKMAQGRYTCGKKEQ